jgi:mRNA degradation ribonuclease J1/J2
LRVEALGVSGAPAPDRLTTTFRLTGGVVVDTGAACHGLGVDARGGIETVLLSHAHLDHTLGLPFLLAESERRVLGLQSTLDAVRESLLDGRIWPDLSERAEWVPIREGETFEAGPWEVEVGPADHTVPCVSYLFRGADGAVAIVGDTRRDDDTIAAIAAWKPEACVVEVSFPDRMAELAERYGHQTPRDLVAWREALGPDCRLLVTHVKPAHEAGILLEIEALGDPGIRVLQAGDTVFP